MDDLTWVDALFTALGVVIGVYLKEAQAWVKVWLAKMKSSEPS